VSSAIRATEWKVVVALLADAAAGPAGLFVEGEAGIGKTTLFHDAIELAQAHGFQVLAAHGSPGEVNFAFAALADLLADVEADIFAGLPSVQQEAVDRILLRSNAVHGITDERAAAAALLSVVNSLEGRAPVLIAIDDFPWLDTPSSAAIRFVARRVRGSVCMFATARTGDSEIPDASTWLQMRRPDVVRRMRIAPLTRSGVEALIAGRRGSAMTRSQVRRIYEISGGNPFYALELARALDDGRGLDAGLPETLSAMVEARLEGLDREAATLLLAAACSPKSTVALVSQATDVEEHRVVEVLERAEVARIVSIVGNSIHFAHPLLASGVYTRAEPAARREMHRRLADIVEPVELKARHLASAAVSGDQATLEALDAAAATTRDRGAPTAAAELIELAIGLGGDNPIRRILAARHHFEAGSIAAARRHLEGVPEGLPAGVIRGAAIMLRGAIDGYDGSFTAAVDALTEGLGEAVDSPALRLQALTLLAPAIGIAGKYEESLAYAREALELADQLSDPALRSQARALWVNLQFLYGRGLDERALSEAIELQGDSHPTHIHTRADAIKALTDAGVGRLDSARRHMRTLKKQAADRGSEIDAIWVDTHATTISIWLGDYQDAATIADDAAQRAEQIGGHGAHLFALTCRAAVAAYTGRVDDARAAATEAIALAHETGGHFLAGPPTVSLGFLDVSRGDYTAALDSLQPLLAAFDREYGTEMVGGAYLPDAIEALIGTGRPDDALPLIEALEDNGRRLGRTWMLFTGARGRSQWLAASGDLHAAEASALAALEHHQQLPMPFDEARTQLMLGQIQRRRRRKHAARGSVQAAVRTFEQIGAPLWAHRARAELSRLSGARSTDIGLTPAEERVALRAAEGMTNREIAAQLFLSPKTVEMNLSSIYRKLGIRSRSQLHMRLSNLKFGDDPDSRGA
jgi:DNA-binding CsgD family transcriptional regulator